MTSTIGHSLIVIYQIETILSTQCIIILGFPC
jgi:hypothetical protein